eukprot:Mycagemm_TRINITY_DN10248_c0_g1::TRINITY_DN10248_c0_g1_i2::g.4063::m.4063 type:complete len:236 gc:universal TRINITY_DN10248_c0_g1_i2:244-951(+)
MPPPWEPASTPAARLSCAGATCACMTQGAPSSPFLAGGAPSAKSPLCVDRLSDPTLAFLLDISRHVFFDTPFQSAHSKIRAHKSIAKIINFFSFSEETKSHPLIQGQQQEHEANDCPWRPISGPDEAFRTDCVAHPGEKLALFCRTENKYLCVTCWVQHDDSHTVMPLTLMRAIASVCALQQSAATPALPTLSLAVAPVVAATPAPVARRREFACSREEVRTQANDLARLADIFV